MCENTMVSGISTPLLCAQLLSRVRLFVIPWIAALQAPLSMAFSRQEYQFSPVQSLSRVRLFLTPWVAAGQASLSIINCWSLLKLTSIKSVMPSNHLILCRPLLLLPSILRSIRGFSNELVLRIRWPKYWSFSFSNSPSNGYSGLFFFRMDWLDLLAWVAIPFPRGSSWPRDWTLISWIAGRFFTVWATREAPTQPKGEHFVYLIVVYLKRFSFLLLVCSSFTNFNCDR